jgi:hypothetical protein
MEGSRDVGTGFSSGTTCTNIALRSAAVAAAGGGTGGTSGITVGVAGYLRKIKRQVRTRGLEWITSHPRKQATPPSESPAPRFLCVITVYWNTQFGLWFLDIRKNSVRAKRIQTCLGPAGLNVSRGKRLLTGTAV